MTPARPRVRIMTLLFFPSVYHDNFEHSGRPIYFLLLSGSIPQDVLQGYVGWSSGTVVQDKSTIFTLLRDMGIECLKYGGVRLATVVDSLQWCLAGTVGQSARSILGQRYQAIAFYVAAVQNMTGGRHLEVCMICLLLLWALLDDPV